MKNEIQNDNETFVGGRCHASRTLPMSKINFKRHTKKINVATYD